jgi:hypothetical protein
MLSLPTARFWPSLRSKWWKSGKCKYGAKSEPKWTKSSRSLWWIHSADHGKNDVGNSPMTSQTLTMTSKPARTFESIEFGVGHFIIGVGLNLITKSCIEAPLKSQTSSNSRTSIRSSDYFAVQSFQSKARICDIVGWLLSAGTLKLFTMATYTIRR